MGSSVSTAKARVEVSILIPMLVKDPELVGGMSLDKFLKAPRRRRRRRRWRRLNPGTMRARTDAC